MSERRYRPTCGMRLALIVARSGHRPSDPVDLYRCRARGLLDHDGRLTVKGQQVLNQEAARG